jgi:cytochrome c oxidase subunit 2
MGFLVVAEGQPEFQSWLARQRQAAGAPATVAAARGQQLFLHGTCPMCHTVGGTLAAATLGPDLTHLGSRETIGAGTLPNDAAALGRWIRDAHDSKPGTRMPPTPLARGEVQDLVAYLESLR